MPVIGPAERVDDVAVVRPLLHGALDHVHALVQVHALVDPGIAEIIEHVRLIGEQLERLLEIGLRLRPLLRALVADAAEIEDHPVRLFRLRDGGDALGIDVGAFGELLVPAQNIAERHDRFEIVRVLLDQRVEVLLRLVRAVERIEIGRHLDRGIAMQRRIRRNALIDLDRQLRLLERFVEIGEREQRQRMVGREIERKLEIDQAEILAAAAAERGAEPVERFGGAGLRASSPAAAISRRP